MDGALKAYILNSYRRTLSSASVSLVASVTLVVMILKSDAGLSTPYRRIIFVLSLGDILASIGYITGPFSSPKGTPTVLWGVGNTATCNANAFIKVYGILTVQIYVVVTCLYYYCKLNWKMSNSAFYEKIEKKIHAFCILFTSAVCFSALFTKTFNPLPFGNTCGFSRFPPGCTDNCTKGLLAPLYAVLISFVFTGLTLLSILTFMCLLCKEAYRREKLLRSANPEPGQNSTLFQMLTSCVSCNSFRAQQKEDEPLSDYLLRIYKRETFLQALIYISYFAFVHTLPPMVVSFHFITRQLPIPTFLAQYMSIIYPAMGVFNVFIYTRPKVKILLWAHPNLSRLTAFLLVVKNGGDLYTDERDLKLCCCGPRQRELDRDPMSGFARRGHDSSSEIGGSGENGESGVSYENGESGVSYESDEDFVEISRAFALRDRQQRENVPTNSSEMFSED
eukprot:CAMPEP_0203662400 /NCGR_PEP_ID=MMETSP0090-20130426/376_1 /ASSEMBLY_ACC=CAM_ASM_001088 /TAXON_ID=426623 /ORGANISM="Chaetoceros affinis, Strain CCMP159" /LENGTH=449 /DNA_ID=CAMNT_0050525173 /DNA_START=70 /DNA_END=1419 /DNA_ORIENTATION=+